MTSEREIQNSILSALSRHPLRLWRQNSGKFQVVTNPCEVCLRRARWIQGAPAGAADLSGLLFDGRRVEIEVKAQTKQSEDQKAWQAMIERFGGVYILARSAEEALEKLP
jgi:hypothetical protein